MFNLFKIITTTTLIALVSGCLSFPQSEQELLSTGIQSEDMCFSQDLETTRNNIKQFIAYCEGPVYVYDPYNIDIQGYNLNKEVITETKGETTVINLFSMQGDSKHYILNVKVTPNGGQCQSLVSVTVANRLMTYKFDDLRTAAVSKLKCDHYDVNRVTTSFEPITFEME